ncbi:MAG: pyruvate kinase [Patescibacteria group bacterium]|nr:pyruvate kinase [Patescibacteria group bacterium]
MKKTKIVATIGPASESVEDLKKLIKEGMNVCRLNFSHGDHDWHRMAIQNIRTAEKHTRKKIGIMADIQGPRVRVANLRDLILKKGDEVFLTDNSSPHNHKYKKEIALDWNDFYDHLKRGDRIYIEDGMIQLVVEKRLRLGCVAKVLIEGVVKPHKGVNIPSISRHMGFLTIKDLSDLEFILTQDVDFIAVSFVADGNDLINLKRIIQHKLNKTIVLENKKNSKKEVKKMPWIVSKVERRKAMEHIDEIIEHSDGIMVARGDLAIEMPQEKVGVFQKDIIAKCIKKKKPVIVATQMMASMIENARPTRAEISDVTNAVIDNADAVMLSNETAMGEYFLEVVKTMSEIVVSAEKSPYNDIKLKKYGKLARILSSKSKKTSKKVVYPRTLKTAIAFSSLRQEKVRISFRSSRADEKRKGALIWGVE